MSVVKSSRRKQLNVTQKKAKKGEMFMREKVFKSIMFFKRTEINE